MRQKRKLVQKRKLQTTNLTNDWKHKHKHAKGAKLCVNIKRLEGEKFPKTFSEVLERQNMKNQTIFEFYTHDNKSKYSSNPMNILQSVKKKKRNYTPSALSQLLLLNLFGEFLTERKYLMNTLIFGRLKYF